MSVVIYLSYWIFGDSCSWSWPLQWRHNDHDSVSNHQPHGCLLNSLFRRRSKKTSKLRVTGLCVGNSPGPVNSPHKGPVTRKMFPFDDVIMAWHLPIPKHLHTQIWVKCKINHVKVLYSCANQVWFVSCDQAALRKLLPVRKIKKLNPV